jgi:hypothetical protein
VAAGDKNSLTPESIFHADFLRMPALHSLLPLAGTSPFDG